MTILAKKTGGDGARDLGPLAPGGMHQAVCVDVIDLGMLTRTFSGQTKEQHCIDVIWQLSARDSQTKKRYLVARRYTLSLHEKADLRKDLQSWFSRPITREQEVNGIDVEKLVGVNCTINVMQVTKDGRTYANVTTIMPRQSNVAKLSIENYVRGSVVEEAGADENEDPFDVGHTSGAPTAVAAAAAPVPDITADDIPF